jgi:hypothetical protein
MLYVAVFFAGMAFPYAAWWTFATVHDRVYMPLIWIPRHLRRCREWEASRTENSAR